MIILKGTENGTRQDSGIQSSIPKESFDKRKIIRIQKDKFEEELFRRPHDRNFAVLTNVFTSDQSVSSVRETQVAIKVLEAVYIQRKLSTLANVVL